jgi:hypothetical protein
MRNILEGASIDESNFLDFDIRKLKGASTVTSYQIAINRLAAIREVLLVARQIERLQAVGNRAYFIEALRWLKGESEISTWHHVPLTTDLSTITVGVGTAIELFTQQLQQNLQGEAIYSQIELAMATAPVVKAQPMTKLVKQAIDKAQNTFDQEAEKRKSEIQLVSADSQNQLNSAVAGVQQTLQVQIDQAKRSAYAEIDQRIQDASAQLRTAESLNDWGKHYEEDISRISKRLFGINTEGVLNRNIVTAQAGWKKFKRFAWNDRSGWEMLLKFIYLIIKNSFSLVRYILSKANSLSGRRTVSFLLLSVTAIVMVIMPLLSMFGYIHTSLFDASDPVKWLAKTSLWLPAVIVLSVGYSFTTKNYRIYSNMLDQYQHRRAVAKTAQGIILGVDSSDETKEFRAAMTAAAATALFEHKATGHLSKKEVESLGLLDVIKTVGR